jgi:uncharacterized membrane protein
MDLSAVVFPFAWTGIAWALAAPLLLAALLRAPWGAFADSEAAHVWYGAIFSLVLLWNLQATIGEGFTFHLLGAAALTLMAGAPLALIGLVAVVAIQCVVRDGLVVNAALVWLTLGAVPVAVTTLVLRFAERRLPPNFFVYIFVAAFFGAALSLGAAGMAGACALALGAGRTVERVFGDYAPIFVYLAFGEATLTGMALTLAVVYRPRWVASFDDARYIKGR